MGYRKFNRNQIRMLPRFGDFGDDESGEEPHEREVDKVYDGVSAGETPPVPIGKIDDHAGGESHDREKHDAPCVT